MSRKSILANQVLQALREEIAEGKTPQGCFLPSEKGLCERFRVSRITVRLALTKLAEAGLILSRPGKGWQVCSPADAPMPERSARVSESLPAPAKNEVFLLTRHTVLSTYLFQGLSDILTPAGYSARLFMLPEGYETNVQVVLDGLRGKDPAAVCLFTDRHLPGEYLTGLQALTVPLLICGGCEHVFCDSLTFDLREGGRRMVHYLCAMGYERIVYHCFSKLRQEFPSFRTRAKGYIEGMTEAGLRPEVHETDFRIDYDTGVQERLIKALESAPGRRTCVLCDTNMLAKSTYLILLRHGFQIPESFGLCGYGSDSDNRLPGGGDGDSGSALACVEEDWYQAGLSSAWQLLSRLRGDNSLPRLVLLKTGTIEGNTL